MSRDRHGAHRVRRRLLASSPRRMLASAGVLLFAGGGLVGTGASFTATSSNKTSVVTAGILRQSNSKDNSAAITAANMAPGDVATGTVDIGNTGDLPAAISVYTGGVVNTPASSGFSNYLQLKVEDLGPASCTTGCPSPWVIYSGTLAGAVGGGDVGYYQPGETHRFRFTVTYPDGGGDGADNAYGGAKTTADITWGARQ